jgi:hypothetical protein
MSIPIRPDKPDEIEAEKRLEALLLEGLQGEESELTHADWKEIRQEAIAQRVKLSPSKTL